MTNSGVTEGSKRQRRTRNRPGMKTSMMLLLVLLSSSMTAKTESVLSGIKPVEPDEVAQLTALSLIHNPALAVAHTRWRRLGYEKDSLEGFFDPVLRAGGGRHEAPTAIPSATPGTQLGSQAYTLQAGVASALRPGAYLSIGMANDSVIDDDASLDGSYRNRGGIRLDVPLLRDRGFARWKLELAEATFTEKAEAFLLLHTMQVLRRDVATTYVNGLQAAANALESTNATRRAKALLNESRQRVELTVLPEYQLHSAALEVALRQEEERTADRQRVEHLVQLNQLCGTNVSHAASLNATDLLQWATYCLTTPPPRPALVKTCRRRGDFLAQQQTILAAEANLGQTQQTLKSDLSLSISTGWVVDEETGTDIDDADDSDVGTEIALTWRRPLWQREAQAKKKAQRARVFEQEQTLVTIRQRIEAEIETAAVRLETAKMRFQLTLEAVKAADRALQSERDRFGLGEGRSRNVLDAQKDLTTTVRRRNGAAADLIRAVIDFEYATGTAELPTPDKPRLAAKEEENHGTL